MSRLIEHPSGVVPKATLYPAHFLFPWIRPSEIRYVHCSQVFVVPIALIVMGIWILRRMLDWRPSAQCHSFKWQYDNSIGSGEDFG